MSDYQDDFNRWIAGREEELLEKFLEKNKEFENEWLEFTWNEFEKHRQNIDDYIAEGQIEDKLMEKHE